MTDAVHGLVVLISFGGMLGAGLASKGLRDLLLVATAYACGAAAMAGVWMSK
jgi:hypothetical protein